MKIPPATILTVGSVKIQMDMDTFMWTIFQAAN